MNNMSTNSKKYDRLYYQNHKEEMKKSRDKWRKENPEKIKEEAIQYYKNHSEEIKENQKQWRKKNPKKNEEIIKQWHKNNPEKVRGYKSKYKRNHPEVSEQRHKKKLQYIQNYKLSKGCSICGYNKDPRYLGFHHPDDNKEYDVSSLINRDSSLKNIKKEMDKCILLCRVCHAKLHWGLRKKKENS